MNVTPQSVAWSCTTWNSVVFKYYEWRMRHPNLRRRAVPRSIELSLHGMLSSKLTPGTESWLWGRLSIQTIAVRFCSSADTRWLEYSSRLYSTALGWLHSSRLPKLFFWNEPTRLLSRINQTFKWSEYPLRVFDCVRTMLEAVLSHKLFAKVKTPIGYW